MRDAYMILDQLADDPANTHTPDGKPATRPHARARLARMIAADAIEFNHRDAVALAKAVAPAGHDNVGASQTAVSDKSPQTSLSVVVVPMVIVPTP